MKLRNATKKTAKFVVGISTYWTVKNVIENNTDPEKRHEKVEAAVGGIVIGSMAAELSETYIDRKVDDFFDSIDEALGRNKK